MSRRLIYPPYTPPSGGGGSYPNKPGGFTNTREIDFSEAVPSGIGSDRAIAGGPWAMIYDVDTGGGQSSAQKVSEGGAPMSPSDVWRMHFQPGTFGASHGVGNIYTNLVSESVTALYTSLHFKFSASYPWHPVSNKWLWWTPGQFLLQSKEGGWWTHHGNLGGGEWLDPDNIGSASLDTYNPVEITSGEYHQIETIIDRVGATWSTWLDDTLVIAASSLTIDGGSTFEEFILEAYRGGGGETLGVDCYNYWDHLHLAW